MTICTLRLYKFVYDTCRTVHIVVTMASICVSVLCHCGQCRKSVSRTALKLNTGELLDFLSFLYKCVETL